MSLALLSFTNLRTTLAILQEGVVGSQCLDRVMSFLHESDMDVKVALTERVLAETKGETSSAIRALNRYLYESCAELDGLVAELHTRLSQRGQAWFLRGWRYNAGIDAQLKLVQHCLHRLDGRLALLFRLLQIRPCLSSSSPLEDESDGYVLAAASRSARDSIPSSGENSFACATGSRNALPLCVDDPTRDTRLMN